jgi:hypothetical protein
MLHRRSPLSQSQTSNRHIVRRRKKAKTVARNAWVRASSEKRFAHKAQKSGQIRANGGILSKETMCGWS